jgi:hypothetical protein
MNILNVDSNYKFNSALTNEQVNGLAFFNDLLKGVAGQAGDSIAAGSQLIQAFMYYPFFKLVYQNQQFSRLEVTLSYEIFSRNVTILGLGGVGYPASQTQTTAQPTQQQAQVTRPQLQPA